MHLFMSGPVAANMIDYIKEIEKEFPKTLTEHAQQSWSELLFRTKSDLKTLSKKKTDENQYNLTRQYEFIKMRNKQNVKYW